MSNVVPMQEEKRIWACGCGCTTFHSFDDGSGECAACLEPVGFDCSGWVPVNDSRVYTGRDLFRTVQGNGSVEFARRRIEKLASARDVAVVVVIRDEGQVHTWALAESPEQFEWVRERMADAVTMIVQGAAT